MTLIDKFNYFFRSFLQQKHLNPSSQLIYLHILNEWNCHRLQSTCFYLSDRELAKSSGLSLRAITESKRVLKNFGLLDFVKEDGRTKYILPSENLYTREYTSDIQNARVGDNFKVSENNYSSRTEKEKDGVGSAKKKSNVNSIDVQKNQAEIENLKSKIQPEISFEERERVKEKMAELLKKFSMPS